MNIIHSKTVKFINAITSHDARENDATQTSEVSKYQIISQPKLDKFQLQCYSKCSKWRPKFDHRRWNPRLQSQRLKIYVQNVHHSREHMHSNDYATAQSLPQWQYAWSSSLHSLSRRSFNFQRSFNSHHGSTSGRPSLEAYPRCCSPPDSNLAN